MVAAIEAKAPFDVFDSWVRWERGQVGIWEFVGRRRHLWHLEMWESGNLKIWDLEIWRPRNPEMWGPTYQKLQKNSKSKFMLPKISARFRLVGKTTPGPMYAIFPMRRGGKQTWHVLNIQGCFREVWGDVWRYCWTIFGDNVETYLKVFGVHFAMLLDYSREGF